jgi:hypothetical protein
MRFLRQLKKDHPPPPYNPWVDGGYDPAEYILSFNYALSKKKLKQLCEKHALSTEGRRIELVKRMYLHWVAAKLELGDDYFGYGPGYEHTRTPDCVCGSKRRADRDAAYEKRELIREIAKRSYRAFMTPTIRRYPRYARGRIRFPRLERND